MPQPGDPYANTFVAEVVRCWRMVHDIRLQAQHCAEPTTWTGRWYVPSGDRWFRVWSCPDHLEGLTGLCEFGRNGQSAGAPLVWVADRCEMEPRGCP
jgi:hypothetical protein